MIDFKYHVVSIVAVFLALAVGIVLGTNVLSGDVLSNLKTQTNDLRKEAQGLRDQNQQLQNQLADDESFAQALEPTVVAGRLTGHRVVVITAPNVPKSMRDDAVKTLTEAGAAITAQVDMSSSYDDPQQASRLAELLATLGTPQLDPTAQDDVQARAAAMLAAALVGVPKDDASASSRATDSTVAAKSTPSSKPTPSGKPTPGSKPTPSVKPTPGVTITSAAAHTTGDSTDPRVIDASSVAVLAGLAKAGFLKVDPQPTVVADMAVVVTAAAPAKPATPSPAPDTSLLDLIAALQRGGSQTVVVGPAGSADAGGLVAELRDNDSLARVVSAIDNADGASGRIAMVFVLAGGAAATGQYGNGQGAQAGLPTTVSAPTTSPPPDSTPSSVGS